MIRRAATWLDTPRGLLCLLALGVAIRLLLARISEGLWFDVTLFRVWSDRLVRFGPAGFYLPTPEYVVDYPPGYLYVLLAVGKVSRVLLGRPPSVAVLKLPAIFADAAAAVLAMLLATRVSSAEVARRIPVRAMAGAAILFNPALVLVSAVWGQVDSFLAVLVLASAYALSGGPGIGREACAVVLLALGAATKPQTVLLMPIVAVLFLWNHQSEGGSMSGRFALMAGLAAVVVVALFMPFGLGPRQIVEFYRNAGSLYQFTSLWAFNVWGAAGFYRADIGPSALTVGGIAAFHVGLVAFAATTTAIVVRCWKSLAGGLAAETVILFGAAAITCAAFALLTRMHERYLYLAVATLAPLIAYRQVRWALAVLSLFFLMNVHFVYVYHSQHAVPRGGAWTIQLLYDAIFGTTQEAWQLKVLSAATAAVCLAIAMFGWEWLEGGAPARQAALTVADGLGSSGHMRTKWDRS